MAVSVSATAPPLAVTVGAVAPLPSKLPPRLPGFKRTRPDSYGPQIQKTPGVPGFGWTASEDAGLRFGRGSRIRTDDHLSPRQVRYQAALYPGMAWIIPASRAAPRLPVQRRSSWRISSRDR